MYGIDFFPERSRQIEMRMEGMNEKEYTDVTKEDAGNMTDAPLAAVAPINESKCGARAICSDACPAGTLSGKLRDTMVQRDEILDISKCRKMAVERSVRGFGVPIELCGKCIAVCRYTQRYIMREKNQEMGKFNKIRD